MLILGLLVILVGVVLILLGVFATEVNSVNGAGQVELVGLDVSATTLFVLGVAAGVAVLWGVGITRYAVRRQMKQRKEDKKMEALSGKLERAEAERRRDLDADR